MGLSTDQYVLHNLNNQHAIKEINLNNTRNFDLSPIINSDVAAAIEGVYTATSVVASNIMPTTTNNH